MAIRLPPLALVLLAGLPAWSASAHKPRMAIFLSRATYAAHRHTAQMAGQGWAGVANLAGLPYDTLFVEEIGSQDLSRYRVLVFAQCSAVEDRLAPKLTAAVERYASGGGNVIVDGPVAGLGALLGVEDAGARGDTTYRIRTATVDHFITRPFEPGQFLSQHLGGALHILKFREGGEALLISTDGKQTFPFLSCRAGAKGRSVAFSDLATSAGATSFFRNDAPQGFYANQVLNAAIRATQWAAYGDVEAPFPAPQVANANVTAMIRHDADVSERYDYQVQTFDLFRKIARESGVVPLYAFVSSGATKTGWERLAPLARELEALGGKIGSHSKHHRIRPNMTEAQWQEELDGSIEEIQSGLKQAGLDIGNVDLFINPGDTIPMGDYEQLARRFVLNLTHGYETDVPVAFGNLTWFTGPHKNFVVVDNSPAPDYQWLYDPTWSYTTAQATAYEEAIFDHMFRDIGRGVIFTLMWHDYSISSMPVRAKSNRIKNSWHLPLYEAVAAKWANYPVYCPEPRDLVEKIRAMAQWDYSWKADASHLEMELDLAGLRAPETAECTGGMGVRIENTGARIVAVTVNGQPHFAYDDRVVILPTLTKGLNRIAVTLGREASAAPHVTYVSKRMPFARRSGGELEFRLLAKSKARFSLRMREPAILLNADRQEWDRKGDHQLNGYVTSDRTLVLKRTKRKGFGVTRATLPIAGIREAGSRIVLAVEGAGDAGQAVRLRSTGTPKRATLGGRPVEIARAGTDFELTLPAFRGRAELEVEFE